MRIVFLAPASEIHSVRWINELARRGHQIVLMTMHTPIDPIHESIRIERLPIQPPMGYILNTLAAKKIVRQVDPDILHIHQASGHGTLGRLIGFHPTVLSVFGTDVIEFPLRSRLHNNLLRENIRRPDLVCSTSVFMVNFTQVHRQYSSRPVEVVPFGVDVDLFRPLYHRPNTRHVVNIGTARHLEPKYGIDVLIRAFSVLRRLLRNRTSLKSSNVDVQLKIAGAGSQRHLLELLAEQEGVRDFIEFLGQIGYEDMPGFLNSLDIFCMPSFMESFGVAAIEAAAVGIPVVASRIGGLQETVIDGESGILVPARDENALATALQRLVGDGKLRSRMGNAGRRFVEKNYVFEKNVSRMESLYKSLLTVDS